MLRKMLLLKFQQWRWWRGCYAARLRIIGFINKRDVFWDPRHGRVPFLKIVHLFALQCAMKRFLLVPQATEGWALSTGMQFGEEYWLQDAWYHSSVSIVSETFTLGNIWNIWWPHHERHMAYWNSLQMYGITSAFLFCLEHLTPYVRGRLSLWETFCYL